MPGPCGRCGHFVCAAEERLALGKSFHLECFTCAICNRGLDSLTLVEFKELDEIYCKSCYRQFVGLQGYGYGPNGPTLVMYDVPEEFQEHSETADSKSNLGPIQWEQPPTRLGKVFKRTKVIPPHYTHTAGGGWGMAERSMRKRPSPVPTVSPEQRRNSQDAYETRSGNSSGSSELTRGILKSSKLNLDQEFMEDTSTVLTKTRSPENDSTDRWSFKTPPPPVPKDISRETGYDSPSSPGESQNVNYDEELQGPTPPPFPSTDKAFGKNKSRTPTPNQSPRSGINTPPPLPPPLADYFPDRENSGPSSPIFSPGGRNSGSVSPSPQSPLVISNSSSPRQNSGTPSRIPSEESNYDFGSPPASPPSTPSLSGSSPRKINSFSTPSPKNESNTPPPLPPPLPEFPSDSPGNSGPLSPINSPKNSKSGSMPSAPPTPNSPQFRSPRENTSKISLGSNGPSPASNNSPGKGNSRTPTPTRTPRSGTNTPPPLPPPLREFFFGPENSGPSSPTISPGKSKSGNMSPNLSSPRPENSPTLLGWPPPPPPPSWASNNSQSNGITRLPSDPAKSNSSPGSNKEASTLNANITSMMYRTSGNVRISPINPSAPHQSSSGPDPDSKSLEINNPTTELQEDANNDFNDNEPCQGCPPLFYCGGKCVGTPSMPRYPPGPSDGRRIPLGPNYGSVRTVPKGMGEPCRRCGRPVFHTELQLGYHGAYHIECFKCCACGKKLDSTSVAEHQGEIFCKGCYRRNFGLHGVGFGIGAGALQTP